MIDDTTQRNSSPIKRFIEIIAAFAVLYSTLKSNIGGDDLNITKVVISLTGIILVVGLIENFFNRGNTTIVKIISNAFVSTIFGFFVLFLLAFVLESLCYFRNSFHAEILQLSVVPCNETIEDQTFNNDIGYFSEAKILERSSDKINQLLNNSFSISVWIIDENPNNDAPNLVHNSHIFSKATPSSVDEKPVGLWLFKQKKDKNIYFRMREYQNGEGVAIKFEHHKDAKWHLYTFIFDRSKDELSAYVDDAKFVDRRSFSGEINNNREFIMRRSFNNNTVENWSGKIRDLRIYPSALEEESIMTIYNESKEKYKS